MGSRVIPNPWTTVEGPPAERPSRPPSIGLRRPTTHPPPPQFLLPGYSVLFCVVLCCPLFSSVCSLFSSTWGDPDVGGWGLFFGFLIYYTIICYTTLWYDMLHHSIIHVCIRIPRFAVGGASCSLGHGAGPRECRVLEPSGRRLGPYVWINLH